MLTAAELEALVERACTAAHTEDHSMTTMNNEDPADPSVHVSRVTGSRGLREARGSAAEKEQPK